MEKAIKHLVIRSIMMVVLFGAIFGFCAKASVFATNPAYGHGVYETVTSSWSTVSGKKKLFAESKNIYSGIAKKVKASNLMKDSATGTLYFLNSDTQTSVPQYGTASVTRSNLTFVSGYKFGAEGYIEVYKNGVLKTETKYVYSY